jgi:hypothetical protein
MKIRPVTADLFHARGGGGRTDRQTDRETDGPTVVQTDRRTDMTTLIVAFHYFAKAPKDET